ncbi:MAG: site-specific DNA-methyltransferase [Eubacteriales bacterium]|nr:site-specific DNA-methyltransferase [Eubacteriales bacterium]
MPIKYVPFIPEPVEGQAVLGNFNRILRYKGADEVSMTLQRGMPLYEMERQETVGENADGNMVIRGECVSACAYLKEQGIQVDLVYIDPPFASGADYAKQVYIRRNPKVAEAIAQAEQELNIDELKSFEEKMYGDVWDKEKYLNWMYENLMAIKSVMSATSSIWVELDNHIGHYVKILMDEIFGEEHFVNEVVWKRTFSHSDVGQGAKHLGRLHDVIFLYSMSDEYVLNTVYTPYSKEYIENFFRYIDEDGRRYRLVSMIGTGGAAKGNPFYEFMGVSRYWRYSQKTIQELLEKGLVVQTKPGAVPQKKNYLDESPGVPLQDIWADIAPVQGGSIENENYATQKPEALLERVINSSSNEGMVVADFFGGSGVTAAVANKLGRRFIHCDIGVNSIQITRDRLKANGAEFDVLEIKDGVQLYRNPVQTMDKVKSLIPGLRDEASLDSFWAGAISDSKLGTIPVYVPNLMDSSSKLLDTVLINRVIHQAIPDLDASVRKVIVYYIDIISEEEIRKFIAEDDSTTVEIELRDLKTVLDDVVIGDYAEFHTEQTSEGFFSGYTVTIDRFLSDRVLGKIMDFNNKASLNSKKSFKPIEVSEEGLELIEFLSLDCTARDGEWHSDSEIKIDKLGYVIRGGEKTKKFWDGTIQSDKQPLRLKIRNICGDETVWEVE